MNQSVISYASGDQLRESTVGKSPNFRDFNWPSYLPDFIEDNTPPPSPLQKEPSSSPFFFLEDKKLQNMDSSSTSHHHDPESSTSFNSPTASHSPTIKTLSIATPPATPTFQTTSHPISISSVVPSFTCFPTPPDTPTSPFIPTLKPLLTPKRSLKIHGDSLITSPRSIPSPQCSFQKKEEILYQNTKGFVSVPKDQYQNDEDEKKKKNESKKTRPKLTLNTGNRHHKPPLPQLTWRVPECQSHENVVAEEDKKEEEQEKKKTGEEEGEKTTNDQNVVSPEAEGNNNDNNNNNTGRETTVLFVIGSDLRMIADQFHATFATVGRILKTGSLNLTVTTAITGCLSVSISYESGEEEEEGTSPVLS